MREPGNAPPRLAEWLLAWVVPTGPVGRSMLGDAREEFERLANRLGLWRARISYWALPFSIAMRFAPDRLTRQVGRTRMRMRDWFQAPMSDVRHAARIVVQRPGLTAAAVITVALGTAAPATMFSITSGILSELPFDEGDRIVAVQKNDPVRGFIDAGVSIDDYRVWGERQQSLGDLAAVDRLMVQVSGAAQAPPALFEAAFMTPSAFSVLRIAPVVGRPFDARDARPGSLPTVIIGYRVWQDLFDRDLSALGSVIRVNDQMRTVVGVMPDGFEFPRREQLWLPLPTYAGADVPPVSVFGRLRDGVSMQAAIEDFAALARAMASERPETHADVTITVQNYARAALGPDSSAGVIMMYTLTLLMSFVLLIACVNVANLLLVHVLGRAREIAIRMALGASRIRIVRQLLAESSVIAVLGGAAGVVMAAKTAVWFNERVTSQINLYWMVIDVDLPVLAFCLGLVAAAAVFSGVLPAWQAAGIDLRTTIADSSRGSTSFRAGRVNRVLVIGEIALSCALLILSGLMVRGVLDMVAKDRAFGQDDVFTARILLQDFDYGAAGERRALWSEFERGLEAQPGVESATLTTRLPGVGSSQSRVTIPGRESEDRLLAARIDATPAFFAMFGIHPLEGRLFAPSDDENAVPVAVVTRAFVEEMFANGDAVGRRFRFSSEPDSAWIQIVGVVEDGGVFSRDRTVQAGVYRPFSQTAPQQATVAIRHAGQPLSHTRAVRATLAALDPHVPLYEVDTLRGRLNDESRFERTMGFLFGTFGIVALVLATVGLYGVVSFGVSRRRQELGIRRALGARSRSIIWVAVRGAMASLAVGLALGIGVALLLGPAVKEALFGRSPTDVGVYLLVVAALSAAATVAALIPSLRAARLAPVAVLRP